ncbi:SpoIIE family protein phosphatase [Streptomyces sp. NBC_01275]|uniref:ATP-binding SpoIIE family protein phosphatase n=1 Tax=Streptomyces sp. NBC_01275 TaxID=2903807 RepID=UPI00224CCE2B|nr:SpoIIE family protein phosphatase [Streptomyces sp. NBC_01275]MCX4767688.1 SpoIIE family protein phosphatase [Streptomyces sp. NBC_01275]
MEPVRGDDDERALVERAFRQASFSMSVFDASQRYLRLNDVACEVMGLDEGFLRGHAFPYGLPEDVDQLGTLQALREVAATGKPAHYESHTRAPSGIREHAWNLELWPLRDEAGTVYAVGMAAFDSSEQHWARQRLAVLDEAAVSVGTSLDLGRTARELAELVIPRFADFASVDLLEAVMHGEEPLDGSPDVTVVLRRVAHLSTEQGTPEAVIGLGATDAYPPYSPPARALHSGRPVLSGSGDPDFDRWIASVPARADRMRGFVVTSLLAVPLIARGTTLGVAVLLRTRPDAFTQDDFTLAKELAGRAALCVDNARRYTRERTTALTLQESLLPSGASPQSAVDVACRYLPTDSRAGVGGDWYDIIPLSGARVGLVVGDVVGHGIQASATMGRLRTAVQTLADVDLPSDELLAHLDDLVLRLGGDDDNGDRTGAGATGATCLYAVYDPVSRMLTVASAGHPPPVLVLPDGTTTVVDVSVGPVLGVGGLPFETTELELPEGSLVALYTDGLVEAVDRDPDVGTARLCQALTGSRSTLEDRCDQVLSALLPKHPSDDVALVLARTRALDADHVKVWDLAADFEVVAEARRLAAAQLDAWGLTEAGFVTELVVSELVTNAIRYGADPIQLRLIHDRTLICEVSDGNSTSPHLRRARIYDEGGRGLLLVAQLTTRWGTRHTATGKTIWAEQALTPTMG